MPVRCVSILSCLRSPRFIHITLPSFSVLLPLPLFTLRRRRPLLSRLAFPVRNMNTTIDSPRDPNTLSNYNNWRTTHTTASFHILFDEQRLQGNVSLDLKSLTEAESTEIILDSSYLNISEVKVNGQA